MVDVRTRSGTRTRLYLAHADGTKRRQVADVVNLDSCFAPDWSRRGRRFAYQTGCDIDGTDLYVVRADGTRRRHLANAYWTLRPKWSAADDSLLFAGSPPSRRGSFAFYLTDELGRRPRRIPGLWFGWVALVDWAWSPDGRSISALLDTNDSNRGLELSVIGRRGGRLRQLTPPELNVGAFDVSPDGQRIVLQASTGTRAWEIYVTDSNGSALTQVTNNRVHDRDPHWSRDGQRIVFTSERDGNSEIYVMNADGTDQTNMTLNPAGDARPSWIPPEAPRPSGPRSD